MGNEIALALASAIDHLGQADAWTPPSPITADVVSIVGAVAMTVAITISLTISLTIFGAMTLVSDDTRGGSAFDRRKPRRVRP